MPLRTRCRSNALMSDRESQVMRACSRARLSHGRSVSSAACSADFLHSSRSRRAVHIPFLLIVAFALGRSGVWERRVIREELAGEVGRTVSSEGYRDVLGDRILRTRRINQLDRWASAALVNAQHELAFHKRRVRDEGSDPETGPRGWLAARHQSIAACHVKRKQGSRLWRHRLPVRLRRRSWGKIGRRRGVNDGAFGVLAR